MASPKSTAPPVIDGFANFYAETERRGRRLVLLDSGINRIRAIVSCGERVPAILVASSPHKIGSDGTPWQDHFEADSGYIRYYGETGRPGKILGQSLEMRRYLKLS